VPTKKKHTKTKDPSSGFVLSRKGRKREKQKRPLHIQSVTGLGIQILCPAFPISKTRNSR